MKYFILLSAVALTALALPVDFGPEPGWTDASVLVGNGTRALPRGQAGFATLNGGTRGGAGGAVWTVWDVWALRNAVGGNDRRIVYIRGRIDFTPLFTASPGVRFGIGNHKSIIGTDRNAMIFGGGMVISNARNVIIQNVRFHNALNFAPGERPNGNGGIANIGSGDFSTLDALGIDRQSENVWVDHCEFADDPWNWRNHPRRHDGLIDITQGASLISISNNVFRNHNHVTLIGNDDRSTIDVGRLKVTFYLNWWRGSHQRHPLVRFGEVHILNNLYTDNTDYGVFVGTASRIYFERNHMTNVRRGIVLGRQVPNNLGRLLSLNNLMQNSPIQSGISSDVGWRPSQYYHYSRMAADRVGNHVRRYAGPH